MKVKQGFAARCFLNDILHDYEDSYVSARVDDPEQYYDKKAWFVNGQFSLYDGAHTTSFFITVSSKEEADSSLALLETIQTTLAAFIDKVKQATEKLDELNKSALTEEIQS